MTVKLASFPIFQRFIRICKSGKDVRVRVLYWSFLSGKSDIHRQHFYEKLSLKLNTKTAVNGQDVILGNYCLRIEELSTKL